MPYKSDKQRRFMHWKHPKIARRWDEEYGGKVQKSIPETYGWTRRPDKHKSEEQHIAELKWLHNRYKNSRSPIHQEEAWWIEDSIHNPMKSDRWGFEGHEHIKPRRPKGAMPTPILAQEKSYKNQIREMRRAGATDVWPKDVYLKQVRDDPYYKKEKAQYKKDMAAGKRPFHKSHELAVQRLVKSLEARLSM